MKFFASNFENNTDSLTNKNENIRNKITIKKQIKVIKNKKYQTLSNINKP